MLREASKGVIVALDLDESLSFSNHVRNSTYFESMDEA